MHNRFANIANYLTMARIMMIPPFFVAAAYHLREVNNGGQPGEWDMMPGEPTFRLGLQILFICIVTTDFLDGYIARRTKTVSSLGSLLDPLADKLFVLTTIILFAVYRQIPPWLAVIIISKEVLVVIGWALLATVENRVGAKPILMGKWAMAFTFAAIFVVVFHFPSPLQQVIFGLAGFTATACFLQYLWYELRPQPNGNGDETGNGLK